MEPLSSAAPPSIVSGDGGDLLPSFPHTRFLPPEENGPSQAAPPSSSPNSDRDGIAFISSSPAISLPSEESESADVRRLPDSGNGNYVSRTHDSLLLFIALPFYFALLLNGSWDVGSGAGYWEGDWRDSGLLGGPDGALDSGERVKTCGVVLTAKRGSNQFLPSVVISCAFRCHVMNL